MKNATRLLLLLAVASAMLLFVFVPRHESIDKRSPIQMRGLFGGPTNTDTTSGITSTHATTTSDTSMSPTTTSSSASTPASSATSHAATSSPSLTAPASSTQPGTPITTIGTNPAGQIITSYVFPSTTSSSSTPTNTSPPNNNSSGLGTGSIIGLAVAGGVAVIAVVLFFVWKFTRKRFTDFDDNEAIKWPELNAHGNDVHALPTNSTGRAGFGPENDSDVNLVRAPSPGGAYASSIAASSVPEVYAGDPYAVPPLPHLNPNQPYRDDPGTYGQPAGYYDPYRGPIPHTFNDVISDGQGAESIPMTQMARTRSPGPQMAYDMPARGSPVPQAAMGYPDARTGTPTPGALGAGRASPGPQTAYYMDNRVGTPNPGAGGVGRASPNPHAGYGYAP